MKKAILILLSLFFITGIYAQVSGFKFRRISQQGGTTFKAINQIIQDDYGFIWFATTDQGIIRYDSKDFQRFRHNSTDSSTLVSSNITRLLVDNNNRLWIATEEGLDLFIRTKKIFKHFHYKTNNGNKNKKYIINISKDTDGNIWVVDSSGVGKLDTVKHVLKRLTFPSNHEIPTIVYFDSFNRGWVGTSDGSIYRINLITHSLSKIIQGCGSIPNTIFCDRSKIYVGYYSHGAREYKINGELSRVFRCNEGNFNLSKGKVRTIIKDCEGNIWIGAYEGLYLVSHGKIIRFSTDSHPEIPHNSIFSIYKDHSNNLWFGTWAGGVFYLNYSDNNFIHYKHESSPKSLSSNIVSSFAELPDGKIVVGTESGGINIFNPKLGTFKNVTLLNEGKKVLNIKSLCIDKNEGLWVGTFKNQLWYKPSGHKNFIHFGEGKEDGKHISSSSVYSLFASDSGIWIGAIGSDINFYNFKTKKISFLKTLYPNVSLHSNYIRYVYVDSTGNLWIGTQYGLDRINLKTGKQTYFSPNASLKRKIYSSTIYFISEINQNIWVGTQSYGINIIHLNNDSVSIIDANGIISNTDVYGFVEDQNHHFWITTNDGIILYDPDANTYRHFTIQDGLQGNIFNPQAIFKDSNNWLYFGGTNGMTLVYPDRIRINTYLPNIILDHAIINNKKELSLLSDQGSKFITRLNLRPFENSVRIEFSSDNYLIPEKNHFKYRLTGLYDEWIDAGNEGSATFTNLSSGNYTFEVIACNNDGRWNNNPTRLFIHISTPWYRTMMAYFIYLLIFLTIIYFSIIEFRNKQNLKKAILIEKIQRKHEEQLHELKLKLFTNISHEFRTPLTLISGPVKKLLSSGKVDENEKDILKVIERNAARLLYLINQIMDFRKIEKGKIKLNVSTIELVSFAKNLFFNFTEEALERHIHYTLDSSPKQLICEGDKEKIDRIIFNLLSNAFKYTPNKGTIRIFISDSMHKQTDYSNEIKIGKLNYTDYVVISISDSGSGLDKDDLQYVFNRFEQGKSENKSGTGIGLSLVKEYTLFHKGEIIAQSTPGKGTQFNVLLPRKQIARRLMVKGKDIDFKTINQIPNDSSQLKERGKLKDNKILIVEDDPDLRTYIIDVLKPYFQIITAPNGVAAIKLLQSMSVNLIVSDVMMPEMNGFEFCSIIKSKLETSHIPVILLTALSSTENKVMGLKEGADAYITKPFDDVLLINQINNLLIQRETIRESYKNSLLKDQTVNIGSLDNYFLDKVTSIIQDNINNNQFSVEDLAKEIGLHRSQLHRKLKQVTNFSTTEYINIVRLKYASELIKSNRFTIDEIANLSGFNSHSYFTKCFTKFYGLNPKSFADKYGSVKHNGSNQNI